MAIERVLVVGGGLMGSGIAQVLAQAGLTVTIVDTDRAALERSLLRIDRGLKYATATSVTIRDRISISVDLESAAIGADHVIESVVEDIRVKTELLRRLDDVCRSDVIFASNTSQYSISLLGASTRRPDRVIGSHWFNPPPLMGLIEIVRGVETSDETLRTTVALALRYGKQAIVCKKDTQGFITSRLIALFIVEAARIVEEGIASVDDVNRACVLAFNHALGPLDTADLSGLDTVVRVADALVEQYGERFRPPSMLRSLVHAGHLGRKSGRGFSSYDLAILR
jgi:3-hydroxybutyryl-CoA dehydrogenase